MNMPLILVCGEFIVVQEVNGPSAIYIQDISILV